jgi:integrase
MAALLARLSPAAQLNWIKALRPMFEFAISIGSLKANPLVDVKVRYKGGELTPWTEVEIKQYRDHHPIGCMARLAIELLYGTVMRSSDVIALGPSNLWNGKLTRRTQKTGKVLTLPILPELQAALDAMAPTAPDSTWLRHQRGGPFKTRSWNVAFAKWVSEAGLPEQFRAHGLRKAGMTRLANFGATPHIIQAWSGHKTLALVAHYTKTADQARLAQEGANILTKAG